MELQLDPTITWRTALEEIAKASGWPVSMLRVAHRGRSLAEWSIDTVTLADEVLPSAAEAVVVLHVTLRLSPLCPLAPSAPAGPMRCPICFTEGFSDVWVTRPCAHVLCGTCRQRMLEMSDPESPSCHMCRREVFDFVEHHWVSRGLRVHI